ATFFYQTTDKATNNPIGQPNTAVNIAGGDFQTFIFGFKPTQPFAASTFPLTFDCDNTDPAVSTPGVNTFLLTSTTPPGPDIVALAATLTNDGIVNIPGAAGIGFFSVASVNAGASGLITATADTGGASLPVTLTLCQTNPANGACANPPIAAS